jgi:NTE family protein
MTKASDAHPRPVRKRPPFECIALVLQGGGALGAYQAGVYQALDEAGLDPDWISGISIGAFNSAIILGEHHPALCGFEAADAVRSSGGG